MREYKKMIILFGIIGLIVTFGLFFQNGYNQKSRNRIKMNLKICQAFITKVSSYTYRPPGHTISFRTLCADSNRSFSSVIIYNYDLLDRDSLKKLEGKTILIAVDSLHPDKYHQLLLTENDFRTYGVLVPDSLRYLKSFEK